MQILLRIILLPVIILWLCSSCTPSLYVDKNDPRSKHFSKYASFDIAPAVANPVYFNPIHQAKVDSTISVALGKRGYNQANTKADFTVRYITCFKDTRQPLKYETVQNWWRLHQSKSAKHNQSNIYISIQIIETRTSTLLWQGQAFGTSQGSLSQDHTILSKTVNQIMSQFCFTSQVNTSKPTPQPESVPLVSISAKAK